MDGDGYLLNEHESPDGVTTTYAYNTANGYSVPGPLMTSISPSDGEAATFTYDSQRRVQTMTIVIADDDDEVITFAYGAPGSDCPAAAQKTTVTFSGGGSAFYCSTPDYRVVYSLGDGEPDFGDGDDGTCTVPEDDPTDDYCGEDDIAPEDIYAEENEIQSFAEPPFIWGLGEDAVSEDALKEDLTPRPGGWNFYNSPHFWSLPVTHARHIVPWDLAYKWQTKGVSQELVEAAKWAKGVTTPPLPPAPQVPPKKIMFSFEKCHRAGCNRKSALPSLTQYKDAIKDFFDYVDYLYTQPGTHAHAALKHVKLFTAWNEPNLKTGSRDYGQPTGWIKETDVLSTVGLNSHKRPNSGAYQAGRFYKAFAERCAKRKEDLNRPCSVIAGEFSDTYDNTQGKYSTRYLKQYRKGWATCRCRGRGTRITTPASGSRTQTRSLTAGSASRRLRREPRHSPGGPRRCTSPRSGSSATRARPTCRTRRRGSAKRRPTQGCSACSTRYRTSIAASRASTTTRCGEPSGGTQGSSRSAPSRLVRARLGPRTGSWSPRRTPIRATTRCARLCRFRKGARRRGGPPARRDGRVRYNGGRESGARGDRRGGAGIEAEQLWHDWSRWASWIDGFQHLEKLEGEWPEVGARRVGSSPGAGARARVQKVMRMEAGDGLTLIVEDERVTATQVVRFETDGLRTRITVEVEAQPKEKMPPGQRWWWRRKRGESLARTLQRFSYELAADR